MESVDTAIIAKMGELGFFGLTIPEEYGGIGGDYLSHGTEDQKQQWLTGIVAGQRLGCFGLTEPNTGSDAGNLETRAVRDGDGYVINGSKIFITNGTRADAARLLVWRCADLIERGQPFGVQASEAKYFASEAAVRAAIV